MKSFEHDKMIYEQGIEQGIEQGRASERENTERERKRAEAAVQDANALKRVQQLIGCLLKDNRVEDARQALENADFRENLYQKYGIK